ncbi:MAG: hypothetical protein HKN19_09445 [Halioglobus sp.]|nr:hypothetical protein [Halioglobus sp.]
MVLVLAADVLAGPKLYRFRNHEGVTVVGYQVPADLVKGGYEVLNDDGMVVQVVPRELSQEELEAQDAQRKLEEAATAEQARLREWDESLLLRYSTVLDIEAARKRALQDFRIRVSILKGNRRSLKQKVENLQAEAADMERRGMTVDVARLRAIEAMQEEIAVTDRAIEDREREIDEVQGEFEADIERFDMLQEVVEMRRSLSNKNGR